jgi:hypothetical protein
LLYCAARARKPNIRLVARGARIVEGSQMLKLLVFSSLFLATATDAFALPLKFACETPQGKRVEQGPPGKATDSFEWIDDKLDNVQPSIVIDGETFSVTWGTTIPNETKGARPKATTYVFASAQRDAVSILATRIDATTAEIFRFYFNNKVLYKLTSSPGPASQDSKTAPPFVATYVASCREQ